MPLGALGGDPLEGARAGTTEGGFIVFVGLDLEGSREKESAKSND
jgi:hypothetical protein